MKAYSLYLDESGDFGEDLVKKNSPECIVGGYLVEGEYTDIAAKDVIVESWKKYKPDFKYDLSQDIFEEINHACRANKIDCYPSVLADVFSAVRNRKGVFCIFSNKNKTNVYDSNKTYLNILSGGVAFVAQRLCEKSNEEICLNVVIGRRVDTAQLSTQKTTISEGEYTRVKEAIAKVESLKGKCDVNLKFESDKKASQLVISDYICNYYFITSYFITSREKGNKNDAETVYKSARDIFIGGENILYVLGDENTSEDFHKLRERNGINEILVKLCCSDVNELLQTENVVWLCTEYQKNPQIVENAFNALDNEIRVRNENRKFNEVNTILDKAFSIVELIKNIPQDMQNSEYKEALQRITFSLYLHKATTFSHQGNCVEQENAFREMKKIADDFPRNIKNTDLLNKYYNRLALFKNYTFDTFGADTVCRSREKELEKQVEFVGAIDELGKMYGTHMQVLLSLYNISDCVGYSEVCEFSEKAIAMLSSENDKKRQYQYRADLEAAHGDIDSALDWLAKGASHDSWTQITAEDNEFILYHLSYIGVVAERIGKRDTAERILKVLDVWEEKHADELKKRSWMESSSSMMPKGMIDFNCALIRAKMCATTNVGRMVKIAVAAEELHITFAPQLYAEIALCKNKSNIIDKSFVCEKLELLSKNEYFTEVTHEFYNKWHEFLTKDEKTLEEFAKTRLY